MQRALEKMRSKPDVGGSEREVQREKTHIHLWPIQVAVQQKPTQYCRAIVCVRSVAQLCPTFCGPMDPLSMGFSRQEYSSGLSFPTPGDLPDPGIKPESLGLLHWQVTIYP